MKNLIILSTCWLCCTGCESSLPLFEASVWQAEADLKKKAERLRQEGITRRDTYLKEHPDLDPEIQQSIEEVAICVAMTKDQVRITWGAPAVIQNHTREMWTYTGIDWWDYMGLSEDLEPRERVYVFFVKGLVTRWHDNLNE
jgi:hypothetical protein